MSVKHRDKLYVKYWLMKIPVLQPQGDGYLDTSFVPIKWIGLHIFNCVVHAKDEAEEYITPRIARP